MHLYRKYTIHRQRHANVCKYRLGRLQTTPVEHLQQRLGLFRGSCADPYTAVWCNNVVVARTEFFFSPKQNTFICNAFCRFISSRRATAATGVCNIVVNDDVHMSCPPPHAPRYYASSITK